jgi:nucleoside-diphosphate-sugar epimerase
MQYKNVLVTGGAGYCGSVLVPQMLDMGYNVTVYDIEYYGIHLPKHENLTVLQGDIRDVETLSKALQNQDAVISLACISNDASFELDEHLSTSVNMDAFEPMVKAAKDAGVKRFVYASSSSVYGVSDHPDVTEDHPLVPLTLYNKYKGLCEPILRKYTDESFIGVTFRPATVCGYSPRQRLDLSVNILTHHAIKNDRITVFGGAQLRPNLHIQDYADLCKLLLEAPAEKVQNEIFNCGYQNMSILDIASLVKKVVEEEYPEKAGKVEIVTTSSDDPRSYHINSDKIKRILDFSPAHSIEEAVRDLCKAFKADKLPDSWDDNIYYNVKRMKALNAQ